MGFPERLPSSYRQNCPPKSRPSFVTPGDQLSGGARKNQLDSPLSSPSGGDPVAHRSCRPSSPLEGNITGFVLMRPELKGKRLDVIREAVFPNVSRVICNADEPRFTPSTSGAAVSERVARQHSRMALQYIHLCCGRQLIRTPLFLKP